MPVPVAWNAAWQNTQVCRCSSKKTCTIGHWQATLHRFSDRQRREFSCAHVRSLMSAHVDVVWQLPSRVRSMSYREPICTMLQPHSSSNKHHCIGPSELLSPQHLGFRFNLDAVCSSLVQACAGCVPCMFDPIWMCGAPALCRPATDANVSAGYQMLV